MDSIDTLAIVLDVETQREVFQFRLNKIYKEWFYHFYDAPIYHSDGLSGVFRQIVSKLFPNSIHDGNDISPNERLARTQYTLNELQSLCIKQVPRSHLARNGWIWTRI